MGKDLSIHGQIEVELIRKDGRIIKRDFNKLTNIGKQMIMSGGAGRLFNFYGYGAQNLPQPNELYQAGNTGLAYQFNTDAVGPVNMLLNISPEKIGRNQNLYLPETSELVGYAYRDSASGVKEGVVATLASGTQCAYAISRRYKYNDDLAGAFNTIAMSTQLDAYNGWPVFVQKYIQPAKIDDFTQVWNTITPYPVTGLNPGEISFAKDSDQLIVNLETGKTDTTRQITPRFPISNLSGVCTIFEFGDYIYLANGEIASIKLTPLNKETNALGSAYMLWSGGNYCGLFNYNGVLYIYDRATVYEAILDNSGLIKLGNQTTVTLPGFTQSNVFVPCGTGDVLYNIGGYSSRYSGRGNNAVFDNSGVKVYETNRQVFVNKLTYMIGDRFYIFSNYNASPYNLIVSSLGNLISYHTFAQPILKNVGDQLYVTYTYYIE